VDYFFSFIALTIATINVPKAQSAITWSVVIIMPTPPFSLGVPHATLHIAKEYSITHATILKNLKLFKMDLPITVKNTLKINLIQKEKRR